MALSEGHRRSLLVLGVSYWFLLIVIVTPCVVYDEVTVGMGLYVGLFLLVATPLSFKTSELSGGEWYNEIWMCGVRKIAYSCSQMGRADPKVMLWWEPLFCAYWGLLIKFINPAILYAIVIGILCNDINKSYGDYAMGW